MTYFDDLKVIAYDPASSSSSASGVNNKVVLDTNSMYKPQARIMHEMGHIAEYLAAHGQARNGYPTANYCWGGEAAPCGHNFLSTEGESVVYVESIASFVADTALYWFSNPAPHSCNSVAACATGTYDVEASVGPGGCNGDGFDFRREVNGQRYFRDLFDDVNGDEAGVNIPHVSFGYILEANADFPEGTGNHQENEFSVSIDGKGLADYGWQFSANSVGGANSANESTLRTNNCAWSAF